MPKSMISLKAKAPAGTRPADAPADNRQPRAAGKPASATERLVERLASARTANEITNVIGLKPIRGRSGPKIAY
ncbi:hypothetical protein QWZ10_03135 [Paracoccus cavernae]|uniref:Uncharacterized protein n=1 Tax=Paracoccus cavernae TaxID=1571207 RepID=A0ABT8D2N9_9RHOB|nr:hypothetical protein [Paracoccus cavernae]